MTVRRRFAWLVVLALFGTLMSCSDNPTGPGSGTPNAEQVEYYAPDLVHDGYVLMNPIDTHAFWIVDKRGSVLHTWPIPTDLRFDAQLLPDGRVLANLEQSLGGDETRFYGGDLRIIEPDGSFSWELTWQGPTTISHHDLEMLPSGNILFIAADAYPPAAAVAMGWNGGTQLVSESLIEVDPATNEVVWRWDAADHLIQDHDPAALGHGDPAQHPELIDVNYGPVLDFGAGDIFHANGIVHDAERDLIFFSINNYSEVWVIDHATTTEEAAGPAGDLVYRFGNPEAWRNTAGQRRFWTQHHPSFIADGLAGAGHLLIFMNGRPYHGRTTEQSVVYELQLPPVLACEPGVDTEPTVAWSWTHPGLYGHHLGSAQRLPGGNTLIAEGDYGYWEVTSDGQVAWKFDYEGEGILEVPGAAVWRGYGIEKDDPALAALGLKADFR